MKDIHPVVVVVLFAIALIAIIAFGPEPVFTIRIDTPAADADLAARVAYIETRCHDVHTSGCVKVDPLYVFPGGPLS